MRRTNGPSSIRTSRAGCVRTILPLSVPRYFWKSASFSICTRATSATTTPFVPGVHEPGKPMSGSICGSTRCALNRTSDQPLPNGNVSRWGLARPHSVNFFERPVGGLPDARAAGQPRTVDVAQPADVIHDLGSLQPLVANLRDHREVELLGRGLGAWKSNRDEHQKADDGHTFHELAPERASIVGQKVAGRRCPKASHRGARRGRGAKPF